MKSEGKGGGASEGVESEGECGVRKGSTHLSGRRSQSRGLPTSCRQLLSVVLLLSLEKKKRQRCLEHKDGKTKEGGWERNKTKERRK